MIREQDLLDAIAECQGERNPTSNTCIKLAAYYTILEHITQREIEPTYSFDSGPQNLYDSGTEFSDTIKGRNAEDWMPIIDDLMTTIQVLIPRLYRATIDKLKT